MDSKNEAILNEYLATRSITPATEKLYKQALDTWDNIIGNPLDQIDRTSLQKWFRELSKDRAPGTIVKYGVNLRIIHSNILEEQGLARTRALADSKELFEVIPFKDLRHSQKKQQKLRDKIVTVQEFQTLINGTSSIRTKAMIAVTYESGCRKGEILSLRLKDIIIRENHWALRVDGKTGIRTVPIVNSIPYIKAWLQLHPAPRDENQNLFVSTHTGTIVPLNPSTFNTILGKLCARLGLRRIYPHMLRHTRLTRLAEDGLGEFQMKSFAGWTPGSNMAARYIHLTGNSHMDAVLKTQGLSNGVTERPKLVAFIQLDNCPNCGKDINQDMVSCPYCRFVLRENVAVSQDARVTELEATVEGLKSLLLDVLNNPAALEETKRRLMK